MCSCWVSEEISLTGVLTEFKILRMSPAIQETLTRKLILLRQPKQKISGDALSAANELVRLLLNETLERASVEAECEQDVLMSDEYSTSSNNDIGSGAVTTAITAKHIHAVAAEILMDFT